MSRSRLYLACGAVVFGSMIPASAAAASAKDGEAVYTAKCKTCHGADGAGNPAIAKAMSVTMKPLGGQTDVELKTAITAGTGKMKPVSGVASGDVDNIIAYVHTLTK